MNTSQFMDRRRTPAYNCQNFAAEVWSALTGQDIAARLTALLAPIGERRLLGSHLRAFKRLNAPVEPCFVLCTKRGHDPHVGVYMRGRVFHLAHIAPEYVSLTRLLVGYTDVRYYA